MGQVLDLLVHQRHGSYWSALCSVPPSDSLAHLTFGSGHSVTVVLLAEDPSAEVLWGLDAGEPGSARKVVKERTKATLRRRELLLRFVSTLRQLLALSLEPPFSLQRSPSLGRDSIPSLTESEDSAQNGS